MLATRGVSVPTGPGWSHEVKWDGVRVLAAVLDDGSVRLTSRNENNVSAAWPELATSPLPGRSLVVDGEVIALNERGLPDFRTLAERMHVRRASTAAALAERVPATFMVFDLLRLDGEDLLAQPLERRRELLVGLDGLGASGWQVPGSYDDGPMLHAATLEQGLEGIVSKRLSSPYTVGARSPHWLKFAHRHRGSYVIGGWRPQEGTAGGTERLAALLVGEPGPDGLAYRGRVGSGIGERQSRQLSSLVAGLAADESPFAGPVPREDARGTHWVDPVLVVDVDTHGAGYERLRQPSFQGVRTDLSAQDL